MYSQQSNSRRDNGFQTAPMLGQQSGTSQPQLLNNNLPSGCFLETLTAVLLFNVVGEISSYFVMTCRAIRIFLPWPIPRWSGLPVFHPAGRKAAPRWPFPAP